MYKWEKLFDSVALERARAIDSSRVTLSQRDDTHIDAAVLESGRTEVSITLRDGVPCIMKCKCPKARGGRKCEHMAAVLYRMEKANAPKKKAPEASGTGMQDVQKVWEAALANDDRSKEATVSAQDPPKAQEMQAPSEVRVPKKRGRKSKAQLEAERIAAAEAAKQAKKEETERRIAEKKAQKAAQKAERKRRRME
ncbi:MAG: hypothetical protein K2O99_12135, partial [Lachnospiraceae bacterium]|nr:hypothetical protein [Lachnospiraceae bacterium]